MAESEVKALVFDVFGTVVDWRTSVIRHARAFGEANGVTSDWEGFADAWRGKYPNLIWTKCGRGSFLGLNLMCFTAWRWRNLLEESGITGVREEAKADLNLAWHRLDPWPDSPAGIGKAESQVHHCHHVQRERGPNDQHGQVWRTTVGLYPRRRVGPGLQARSPDLPDGCGFAGVGARAGYDGGSPPGRPAGGGRRGPQNRFRPAALGVWPRPRSRPDAGPILRHRSRRLSRPGLLNWVFKPPI